MEGITREAFAQAYEDGHSHTVNFLQSKGFPPQEAEETAQAAWVRGWERRWQLRQPAKAIAWVNRIALNLGRTRARRESNFQELGDMPARPAGDVSAKIEVERMLQQCPDRDRILLEKRYLQELDIEDLAELFDCTRTAIRVRLHRARRSIRSRFDQRRNGPPGPMVN